jgi:hypothetical protein
MVAEHRVIAPRPAVEHEQRQRPVTALDHEQPSVTSFYEATAHGAILTPPDLRKGPAKLRGMSSDHHRRVTLTGDYAGEYVVVEERADGSLLVTPDPAGRPAAPARRAPARSEGPSLFAGLLSRPARTPPDVPTILEDWGVALGEDEPVNDFILAEIDGRTGFLAITSQRFIFGTNTGRKVTVVEEHLLSSARDVELIGRRRWQKLRVTWHGAASVISVPDRDALARLHQRLTAGKPG